MRKKKSTAVDIPKVDKLMNAIVTVFMILLAVVVLYPMIYIVSSSFSSGQAVSGGKVLLWPVDFSTLGYQIIFNYKLVWTSYGNTIFYTVVGTFLNVLLTTLAAYPLSRKGFQGRKLYTAIFIITMFFSGGMIPTYILMSKLHLTNTRWVLILNGAISVYNTIVMRTFFQSNIPSELFDAARIDGASDFSYLIKIVLPLSKAVFAVIILYYAVAHWNSYFNAMLYLRDRDLYPLQLVLREILNASNVDLSQIEDADLLKQMQGASDLLKYALIIVSAAPILIAYQFVQKYFKKGVMVGSVKG